MKELLNNKCEMADSHSKKKTNTKMTFVFRLLSRTHAMGLVFFYIIIGIVSLTWGTMGLIFLNGIVPL